MKRLFGLIIASLILTAGGIFAPAASVSAAPAANDSLTVTVTLDNNQTNAQAADQLILDLKQGSTVKDHLPLAQAASDSATINFTPVVFASVKPGSYQLCIDATSKCQAVTKTDRADAVSFTPALGADDLTALASGGSDQNAATAGKGCEAQELSWIICPIVRTTQSAISGIENNVIVPFLQTAPLSPTNPNGSKSAIFAIWEVVRTLANALLIVVFLALIFAHTLSIGTDAYTIKRTLPRLVAAAILIQFSFLLASIAIDVTNILGSGITSLVNNTLNATGVGSVHITTAAGGLGLTALVAGLVAAIGSVLTGAIFIILISALFGVLGVFLTLIARQIIITLLIVISPIAFLLWVLPNTQGGFDYWRKNFVRILLMYPLIVMLFAASRLFGVIATASGGGGFASSDVRSLVAVAAAIIPLFLIPAMFKFAGSMMVTASGWSDRLRNSLNKRTTDSAGYQQLRDWSSRRKTNLKYGQGISFGALRGNQAVMGGNKAKLVFGYGPLNMGKAAQTRGIKELRRLENEEAKRIGDANLGPDGNKMVLRGRGGAAKMIADQQSAVSSVRRSYDAGNATRAEVDSALHKLEDLKSQEALARQFYGNRSAEIAAANKLGEIGFLDGDDAAALQARARRTGDVGKQYANIAWGQNKFKLNDANPVLASTSMDGFVDLKGAEKSITGRPAEKLKLITKDGAEAIAGYGLWDKVKPETLDKVLVRGEPNSVPDVVADIIAHYRESAGIAARGSEHSRFLRERGWDVPGQENELLSDKGYLGGLIAAGTGNSPDELRLRVQVSNKLADAIRSKENYAETIAGKPRAQAYEISDDDLQSLRDYYEKVWTQRVSVSTGRKKEGKINEPNG